MYICSCRAVTDKQIRESIASGNQDLPSLMQDTGAGEGCRSCHEELLQMILEEPTTQGQEAPARRDAVGAAALICSAKP